MFSKEPVKILRGLKTLYPLKGVGKPEFYLRGDVNVIKMAKGSAHAFSARTYIKNVCDKIEKKFKATLRNYGSPLEGVITLSWTGLTFLLVLKSANFACWLEVLIRV